MLFLLSQSMFGYNQTYVLFGDTGTTDLKSYTLAKSNFRYLTRTVLILRKIILLITENN